MMITAGGHITTRLLGIATVVTFSGTPRTQALSVARENTLCLSKALLPLHTYCVALYPAYPTVFSFLYFICFS